MEKEFKARHDRSSSKSKQDYLLVNNSKQIINNTMYISLHLFHNTYYYTYYKLKPYINHGTQAHYKVYLKHSLKFRCVLKTTSLLQLWDHRCFCVITGWHMLDQSLCQHFAIELLEHIFIFNVLENNHLQYRTSAVEHTKECDLNFHKSSFLHAPTCSYGIQQGITF